MFAIDALILFVFCRLYTRTYRYHQAIATSMIGGFYRTITPGTTGAQIMEAYTMKQQGVHLSNAASILVMWFIVYRSTLTIFDLVTLILEWQLLPNINALSLNFAGFSIQLPIIPIVIIGFLWNIFLIFLLYLMSFSRHFHNFILHYAIGFLGNIHLIKNPDKTRENLRVQVENFKVELRRLQSNIPLVFLLVLLFLCYLVVKNSIPYFAMMATNAFGEAYFFNAKDWMDSIFLGSFHQMCAELIPLPGQAGVSEYFYNTLYTNFIAGVAIKNGTILTDLSANVNASQLLWRGVSYYLVILVGGLVAGLYRSRPKETYLTSGAQTFVDLQFMTFEERKESADTLYETRQLSRKEIQNRLLHRHNQKKMEEEEKSRRRSFYSTNLPIESKPKEEKAIKKKKNKKPSDDDWFTMDIE